MEVPRPFLKKVTSIGSNEDETDCQSSIDVGSIDRLQKGQTTMRFELARCVYLMRARCYDVVNLSGEYNLQTTYFIPCLQKNE